MAHCDADWSRGHPPHQLSALTFRRTRSRLPCSAARLCLFRIERRLKWFKSLRRPSFACKMDTKNTKTVNLWLAFHLQASHMLACVRGGKKHPQPKIWPYLLRNVVIDRSNQVWCADSTYIPMRSGFLNLVAIMGWYSRKVLGWRLSNSLDADLCVEALKEDMARRRYSIQIRAASSPVALGSMC